MKEFHTSRIILSQASLTLMSVTKSISVRIGFVEMSDIWCFHTIHLFFFYYYFDLWCWFL